MRVEEIQFMNYLEKNYTSLLYIDVGANIGSFTKNITDRINIERGYLFEPLPSCYEKLKRLFTDIVEVPL